MSYFAKRLIFFIHSPWPTCCEGCLKHRTRPLVQCYWKVKLNKCFFPFKGMSRSVSWFTGVTYFLIQLVYFWQNQHVLHDSLSVDLVSCFVWQTKYFVLCLHPPLSEWGIFAASLFICPSLYRTISPPCLSLPPKHVECKWPASTARSNHSLTHSLLNTCLQPACSPIYCLTYNWTLRILWSVLTISYVREDNIHL